MRILLVEDNPIDQLFVTKSLQEVEDFVYELEHVTTLASALECMSTTQFDVILLDLWLPDSEGVETCLEVVAPHRHCPVVVMTSSDDHALATEAIRNGAQDYLVKGAFPGSAIARVLQYAIDRYQFHRELATRESRFNQILNGVPAIIWTTDRELQITSLLGAALEPLELDPSQVVGRTVGDYVVDQPDVLLAHQAALDGRGTSLEAQWNGRTMELQINTLRSHEGEIQGTIGAGLDVTAHRSLKREISFASAVQKSLLPHEQPQVEGFDIYGASYPARQTCGDWYDFIRFSDGSLGVVVGDVSGKGFGPAILSASMTAFLEVLAETHDDLAETLDLCNRLACKRQTERFAVLSLGQIRDGELALNYCGAGEEAYVVGADGQHRLTLESNGVPLGITDEYGYTDSSHADLCPGDVVLFLTDGFREAMNHSNEQFGLQRVLQVVGDNVHRSAAEIFDTLRAAVHEFTEGSAQQDDMTGVILRVTSD